MQERSLSGIACMQHPSATEPSFWVTREFPRESSPTCSPSQRCYAQSATSAAAWRRTGELPSQVFPPHQRLPWPQPWCDTVCLRICIFPKNMSLFRTYFIISRLYFPFTVSLHLTVSLSRTRSFLVLFIKVFQVPRKWLTHFKWPINMLNKWNKQMIAKPCNERQSCIRAREGDLHTDWGPARGQEMETGSFTGENGEAQAKSGQGCWWRCREEWAPVCSDRASCANADLGFLP